MGRLKNDGINLDVFFSLCVKYVQVLLYLCSTCPFFLYDCFSVYMLRTAP